MGAVRCEKRAWPRGFGALEAKLLKMRGLLAEALDSRRFVIVHIKNRHQLRDLQHLAEFRSEIAQL